MIAALVFVAVAGAIALVRYAVSVPLNTRGLFPWGTLVVNASGSLALGVLAGATPVVVTVAGTAALGAYTTFSKFAVEVDTLVREGAIGLAGIYVLASCVGCIAAAWLGLVLA